MALTVRATKTTARGVKALAMPKGVKKAATAAAGVVPAIVASPAFALVDDRLNGEGAGIPLGVNDPILGWILVGVFGTVWAIYASSAKAFGGQDEEDGLSL